MKLNALFVLGVLFAPELMAAETNTLPVTVFFQKKTTLSAAQLQAQAKAALGKKGIADLDHYHCAINVTFAPPNAGCIVLFTRGFEKPYHQVRFDHEGKIVQTFSGVMKEYIGTSRDVDPALRKSLGKEGVNLKEEEKK